MNAIVDMNEWCRQERQRMTKQLAALEAGRCKTGEDRGHGWVETTRETMSRLKLRIDELDEILGQYDQERSSFCSGNSPGLQGENRQS